MDPREGVCQQMLAAGLVPPAPGELLVDGRVHAWRGIEGKRKKSSWYVLRELTGRAGRAFLVGAFGDHRLGLKLRLEPAKDLPAEDLAAARRAITAARKTAERQRAQLAARAARRAARVWARLAAADPAAVPYLRRKGVGAHGGARMSPRGALVLPCYGPEGALAALEFIHATPRRVDGEDRPKDFWPPGCRLSGAWCRLGADDPRPSEGPDLVLAEGYATGASVHEATGWPVLICFSAENLVAVAQQHAGGAPGRILIAGDDDYATPNNPGAAAADRAAAIVEGRVTLPRFAQRPADTRWTDWNDLHLAEGLQAVRAQLVSAWSASQEAAPAAEAAAPETDLRVELRRNDRGALLPTLANAAAIFAHDRAWAGVLAWCEFSARLVKRAAPPWGGPLGEWDDADFANARIWLSHRYGMQLRAGDVRDVLLVQARTAPVHPVRKYLAELRWDGENRLPTWLADYLGAEETDYNARAGTLWMISAVARIMQPPCKADGVLILEGGQGYGKSTALGILAGEWFSDTPFNLRDKDAMQGLAGLWIVELAELESLRGASAERANAFLSSARDHYRPAYGRHVGSFPRQCVFAGTANPDSYLTDPTGGRRYWPVRCGERIRLGPLQQARDQLWAEALHRWRAGEHWWPERQEWAAFAEEQAQRYQEDPWEEIIERYLNAPAVCNQHYCTVAEVLREALKFETARIQGGDGQRVGRILQRLGWQKARLMVTLDGDRRRRNLYQRPDAPPEGAESGEESPAYGAAASRPMH